MGGADNEHIDTTLNPPRLPKNATNNKHYQKPPPPPMRAVVPELNTIKHLDLPPTVSNSMVESHEKDFVRSTSICTNLNFTRPLTTRRIGRQSSADDQANRRTTHHIKATFLLLMIWIEREEEQAADGDLEGKGFAKTREIRE
ncbi:hypothetical protein TSUD_275460 [Trifolium subterraneum]|uniref:Uncharacterized protein n=1 Tax=Trifolium subterraneum TaxID=3900 RepID=A0A2Z6MYE0_TRISU|nr:hypothetical protein TSUD_275460 [Trifolium subterraneum]